MKLRGSSLGIIILVLSSLYLSGENSNHCKYAKGEFGDRYHALIIGIDTYSGSGNRNTNFKDLIGCVRGANELKKILMDRYYFKEKNIKMMTGEKEVEEQTRNNIINGIVYYNHELKETDSLLVYFSGHGVYNNKLDIGYWVAADGLLISGEEVRRLLYKSKARNIFIVFDACYSAKMFPGVKRIYRERNLDLIHEREKHKSKQVLSSGEEETPPGTKDHLSPFCQAFLNSLEKNVHEIIDAQGIIDEVTSEVEKKAKEKPPVGGSFAGYDEGQFIFHFNYFDEEEKVKQHFDRIFQGLEHHTEDRSKVLEELGKLLFEIKNFSKSHIIDYYKNESEKLFEKVKNQKEVIEKIREKYSHALNVLLDDKASIDKKMKECNLFSPDVTNILKEKLHEEKEIIAMLNDLEVKEKFNKIKKYKEMIFDYVRAHRKKDYEKFLNDYKDNIHQKFSDKLIENIKERLDLLKMKRFLLKGNISLTQIDISNMENEVLSISIGTGYFLEGKKITFIPFLEIGSNTDVETVEFGIKDFIVTARLYSLKHLRTGVDIPFRRHGRDYFYFSVSHTLYFIPLKEFKENKLGELTFQKRNHAIGLSTIDLGFGVNIFNFEKKHSWKPWGSFGFEGSIGIPIKNKLDYVVEITDDLWVAVPYKIKKFFFKFKLSWKIWLGKKK